MQPWLAIDYGAVSTRAVLVWPSGAHTVLTFDGTPELSSAAHVTGDDITVGAAAWQKAADDPDGFVASPLRAAPGPIVAGGRDIESGDLAAATLRRVAAEATRLAGEPVDDVRLVVPAGWGPRRRTWLRNAARKAGLPVSRLTEAPVAATCPTTGTPAPATGQVLLVIDIGGGCEVTVVHQGPAGAEVLSTLADPDAGGDRIDTTLIETLTGTSLDDITPAQVWPLRATVRTGRHALTDQVAVTVPLPAPAPPAILNTALLRQATQPVFERAAELAADALANADLTLDDVAHTYLIGGVAVTPSAAEMIAAKLGVTPTVAARPHLAAVLGAADADPDTTAEPQAPRPPLPPLRRLIGLGLPAAASLALFAHFIFAAEFNNGTPFSPRAYYYVIASWGELTVAAVFAMIAFLQAGSLIAVLLDHRDAGTTSRRDPDSRITGGLLLAVAAGLATTVLYALTTAVYFSYGVNAPLRWSLLPVLPIAAAAILAAALT